jgi:hypothetical protein
MTYHYDADQPETFYNHPLIDGARHWAHHKRGVLMEHGHNVFGRPVPCPGWCSLPPDSYQAWTPPELCEP